MPASLLPAPTWEMSLDDWRWVFDVNIWGVIHGVKAFTPLLLAQGEPAHIVNVVSLAAFVGIGHHAPLLRIQSGVPVDQSSAPLRTDRGYDPDRRIGGVSGYGGH